MPFPVDTKWVHETEKKLGVKFPAGFVTSMVAMNGGSVRTSVDQFQLYPFLDASDRKRIQRTCSSIDRETANARKNWYGFPETAVAIGANGGGDLLSCCLWTIPLQHSNTPYTGGITKLVRLLALLKISATFRRRDRTRR